MRTPNRVVKTAIVLGGGIGGIVAANRLSRGPSPGDVPPPSNSTVDSTREFLATYMREFHGYITRVYTAIPRASGAVRRGVASIISTVAGTARRPPG